MAPKKRRLNKSSHKEPKSKGVGKTRMRNLDQLAQQAKEQLGKAAEILKRSLQFYRKAGHVLRQAKRELKAQGGPPWATWLETKVGIQIRAAQLYMRLNREWDKITTHPDFRVDLNYLDALRLIRKISPRSGKSGTREDEKTSLSCPAPSNQEASLPETGQPETTTGQPKTSLPETGQPETKSPEERRGTAGKPRAIPKNAHPNVTAKLAGEVSLVVSPREGYSLQKVLGLVRGRKAKVQEGTNQIALEDGEAIATFTVANQVFKLSHLALVKK